MVILGTTGMRASVTAAWPAMCRLYEGVTRYMYADTKGLVTTGVGFLIDSATAAQALPWKTKAGTLATTAQVTTEWKRVKGKTSWTRYSGLDAVWKDSAVLFLDLAVVDAKLLETTQKFWARLRTAVPLLDSFPADAQLALMDLAWQNGPGFLDAGSVWTGTRAAVLAQDWAKATSHVPGDVNSPRAIARRRLFTNAAAVVRLGLDPDVLWDTKTPTTPATPKPPTEAPLPKYAPRHGKALADYAKSKVDTSYGVGWCQKFTNECGQTGSVSDYDGDKAADAEDGWKKAVAMGKVVKAADVKYADIPPGVYHYWTGGSSDHGHAAVGIGGRRMVSTDMTDKGPRYGKIGECDLTMPRIHWGLTYAGYALIEGNGYTLTDPPKIEEDDMPSTDDVVKAVVPALIKAMKTDKDLQNLFADALLNRDAVPNAGALTSNVNNEHVTPGTAFAQLGKKGNDANAKLDALIARFPVSPPSAA